MNTTKKQIAQTLANETGQTHEQALQSVQVVLDSIADSLAKGERIELRDFGTFEIRRTQPKVGNNPRTGERVEIPARSVVKFSAGKALKARVAINATLRIPVQFREGESCAFSL